LNFTHALSQDFPDSFPGREIFIRAVDVVDSLELVKELLKHYEDYESIGLTANDLENENLSLEEANEMLILILEGLKYFWKV